MVIIIIPVYKAVPDADELFSLEQCIKILHRHPITFVAPQSLDLSFYERYCNQRADFNVTRFDDYFFSGIPGYNELMLSASFYKSFSDYKYILIYQLDAFIFRDELETWCKSGYDFIGAPYVFVDLDNYPIKVLTKYRRLLKILNKAKILKYQYRHVGNGGLSLRHVNHTIRLLSLLKKFVRKWPHNEDSFFTYYGNLFFLIFKLAPEQEALRFSFEEKPDQAYRRNNNKLPFGCHAYQKHNDNGFWDTILKSDRCI
ncbi:MAG: hypothetical protein JWQ66_4436 [Mucilaginibacter sp.]|nr:hypothetical protein [Mucilaginibacter sp.]